MPIGPAGKLLFAILGTDAVWKVLDKALDPIPKVLRQPPPQPTPASSSTDDFRARHQELEAEVRRQAEVLARIGATIEDLASGLRPLVVRVTVAFWMSAAALVVAAIAVILAIRG
jgi:hypothetical protein